MQVVQLQGDQREKICQMLVRIFPLFYPEGATSVVNLPMHDVFQIVTD